MGKDTFQRADSLSEKPVQPDEINRLVKVAVPLLDMQGRQIEADEATALSQCLAFPTCLPAFDNEQRGIDGYSEQSSLTF